MTGTRVRAAGHDILRLSGMEPNAISGVLAEAPLYHFLNRRHNALLPAIDRALAATMALK